MTRTAEHGMDRIAEAALERVARQAAFRLHVSDGLASPGGST